MSVATRILGAISPSWALRRMRARIMLQHVRAYEGASRADGWRVRRAGASARADHKIDGRELRNRARALEQNVPYVARGLSALTSATIGTGIEPKAIGAHAEKLNDRWERWAKQADADGLLDVFGLQALAHKTMKRDGEVLIRRRRRRPSDGLAVPIQLQVLEIDWLDEAKNGEGRNGGRIIDGIEYDILGKPAAYWLYNQHPGDLNRTAFSLTSTRIPAADIIHLYKPERPGQGRGITVLASVIARVRDLMLYEDAELARKNLEARLGVLVSADPEKMANPHNDGGAEPLGQGDLGELPSGGITRIPDGMDATFIEPKAAGGFVEYCSHNLHLIAAGMGVPYESMTGDMHRVNFSSARIRQIEFRRDCEQEQWLCIVPVMCDRIWVWFEDAAVDAGHIPRATYEVDHATPRWDYVNPQQDIRAEVEAIGAGLLTPSESLRRRGYDPGRVFAEMGQDFEAMQSTGALELMTFMRQRRQATRDSDATTTTEDD